MEPLDVRLAINPDAPVYLTETTGSTMDDARQLVTDEPINGTAVVTDYQSAGRGRRAGRVWIAPPRTSLMCTIAIRDDAQPATLSLALAGSLAAELSSRLPRDAAPVCVKWPNDVLIGDRKVAGILADFQAPWIYLGFGVNLLQPSFPAEIAASATSLLLEGGAESGDSTRERWSAFRNELLSRVIMRLATDRADWRRLVEERLWAKNQEVSLLVPNGDRVNGVLTGIMGDGRLTLQGKKVHHVAAGEVSLVRGDGS